MTKSEKGSLCGGHKTEWTGCPGKQRSRRAFVRQKAQETPLSPYSLLPKRRWTLLIALPLPAPLWEAVNINTNNQGEFDSKGRRVQQFLTRLRARTVLALGSSPEPLRGLAWLTRAEAARQPTVTRSRGLDKLFLLQFSSCDITAPCIHCK